MQMLKYYRNLQTSLLNARISNICVYWCDLEDQYFLEGLIILTDSLIKLRNETKVKSSTVANVLTVKMLSCLKKALPNITFGHDSITDSQDKVKDTKRDHLWLHARQLLAV